MTRTVALFGIVAWALGGLAAGCSRSEPQPASSAATPPAAHSPAPAAPVPPYHESAEAAKPFPPLMPASRYRDYPLVERAYRIASGIPGVIAQQPCFCHCDRVGHRSLLDCYASDHGAG